MIARISIPYGLLVFAGFAASFASLASAQQPSELSPHAWTLASANEQLRKYPRDPYLQYVALQLERRQGGVIGPNGPNREWARGNPSIRDRRTVDLFNLFSGALAVQESLQLDALAGGPNLTSGQEVVPIQQLVGPTVQSHPWKTMLAGRKPDVSKLSLCVPEDFLFVQFRSVPKAMSLLEQADQLGAYVFSQMQQEARTQATPQRILKQLAIDVQPESIARYASWIDSFALTSSDLFFGDGTDVTLLVQLNDGAAFRESMDRALNAIPENFPGTLRSEGRELDVPYLHVASPDRTIHLYSAYPRPDLHVRSNSKVAMRKVLEIIKKKSPGAGKSVALGETDEFAFIRTMMPEGALEEDGLIYMSDPFIRKLVGPRSKLNQQRRLVCYNHLRMIGHAALMHATERGEYAGSIAELVESKCLPQEFQGERFVCPSGGEYSLASDGMEGSCSLHGCCGTMVPGCELPLDRVTEWEAKGYQQFVTQYNQYWRTFFDPIAIRLQWDPKRVRAETVILPLIDNSIYTELATALQGPTQGLDPLPVPDRNIFSMSVKWNKANLLARSGLGPMLAEAGNEATSFPPGNFESELNAWRQVGLAMHNFESAFRTLPPRYSEMFHRGLSWRVQILPFLGQGQLYGKFRLNEPWDSEHNRKLIPEMPAVYRVASEALHAVGKTTMVLPRYPQSMFPASGGVRFAEVTDGLSNTAMLVEADPDHGVVWTQPDDWNVDPDSPKAGWAGNSRDWSPIVLGDGSVVAVPKAIEAKDLLALITRAGGEEIPPLPRLPDRRQSRNLFFNHELLSKTDLKAFLMQGIGDQIGIHICDADPLVDFNVPQFLGMMMGRFSDRSFFLNPTDPSNLFALLAISINVPVYVAIPVVDSDVVDEFLDGLDQFLSRSARESNRGFNSFFSIQHDFYRFHREGEVGVRSYSLGFGPIKWHFYWGRIGDGLYVASKPFIMDDLMAMERSQPTATDSKGATDSGPVGHGMVRVRPQHWNHVLKQYRIGWAENQRQACIHNLGPMSSLSRARHAMQKEGKDNSSSMEDLHAMADRLFDSRFYCPSNGHYTISEDGNHVHCSVHGSADAPTQPIEPAPDTRLGQLMGALKDVYFTLEFLEDGLHAVVVLDKE